MALFACSSETTVNGTGGAGSGGASGGGGSPTGGGAGGTAGSAATGGGGTAGSGGSTPTGGTGGGGTGGTGGADCDAGPIPCGVEIVAQGVAKPFGLTVHDSGVYFTNFENPGQVLTCPKTGCTGAPSPVAANQNMPRRMARYGAKLFWTNNASSGSVVSCTIPCASTTTVKSGTAEADHIAVSPTHVFFSDSANWVHRCEHSGAGCIPMIQAEGPVGGLVYAATTDFLYWSVPSKAYIRGCKATVCADGQPNLIQGNFSVSPITTNPTADTMFSAHELKPSPLKKCAMTGCGLIPTKLNTDPDVLDKPVSIAADDLNVFVLEATARVSRCAVSGCTTPTFLASADGAPGTVTVDETYVYWTATINGVGYVLRRNKTN